MGAPQLTLGAAAVAAGAIVVVLLVPATVLLLIFGAPDQGPRSSPPGSGIPRAFVPIYRQAERVFGVSWLLLASIHRTESGFGAGEAPGVRSGVNYYGCCAGPMQFCVTPGCARIAGWGDEPSSHSTWGGYRRAYAKGRRPRGRYPNHKRELASCRAHRGERPGCVYDSFDAIMAAAALLRDKGAGMALDEGAWRALSYYGASAGYADGVLAQARQWAAIGEGAVELPFDFGTTPGGEAKVRPDGTALAPARAPRAVKGMIAAGNAIANRPYAYGGGHPNFIGARALDCSSSTSYILHGGGVFGTSAITSSGFMGWGRPGPGRWVSVFANTGHVWTSVAGLRNDTNYAYDSGPNAGERGPRWRLGPRPAGNFVIRHPAGL